MNPRYFPGITLRNHRPQSRYPLKLLESSLRTSGLPACHRETILAPVMKMGNQRWYCCSQRHRNHLPRSHSNQTRTFGRMQVGQKMVASGMTTDQFDRKLMAGLSVRRWTLGTVQIHWTSEFGRRWGFVDRRLMAVMIARTLFGQRRIERSQRGCPRLRRPQSLQPLFQGRNWIVYRKIGQILSNQTSAGKVSQGHRNQWKVG